MTYVTAADKASGLTRKNGNQSPVIADVRSQKLLALHTFYV